MEIKIEENHPSVEVLIKCPKVTDEVERMISALQGFGEKLSGVKDGKTYFVGAGDVFYFESVDKKCFIYTETDVYEIGYRLYELEERLTEKNFIRIAKAQIVNIAKVKSLCPDFGGRIEVVLINGEKLTVSRQYSKSFKERLGLR
jgi:DNA-binding LytR/AlgR family response regulator